MEQNKPQTEQDISQQAAVRRQKLADLRAAGSDPFVITKYPQDSYSADLKAEFADLPAEAETGKIVSLAGRMMSKRIMGKASFAHLRDQKGDIQIFVKRDLLGDEPDDGGREPGDRSFHGSCRYGQNDGRCLRAVPPLERAQTPAGRHPFRR